VLTKPAVKVAIEDVATRYFPDAVILTDDAVTGGELPADHQARNTWLRKNLYQQDCIEANFLAADEDAICLRPLSGCWTSCSIGLISLLLATPSRPIAVSPMAGARRQRTFLDRSLYVAQFLAEPWCRARSAMVATGICTQTHRRPGLSDQERGEDLAFWRAEGSLAHPTGFEPVTSAFGG
jgi:hypothetical protein